jgi:O-antigen/teichoic acid export membrane protein
MSVEIAKSVSKSVAVLTGTQIITYVSSFILMIFLPRYLGPEEYGRLYLGMSMTGIFTIFVELGCRYSIAKAVARDPRSAGSILVNAVGIRIFFWLASFAALMILTQILNYSDEVKAIMFILGFGILGGGIREVLRSFFQGLERMEYPSYAAIVDRAFMTVAGVTALLLGAKAVVIAVIMVGADTLYFILSARFARQILTVLPKIDWKASVAMIKDGMPYFLQSIFGFIYYRIDTVMLSLMTPVATVGWYGASYKFFDTLMFVPNIYSIAVFPVLSRLWQKDNLTVSRIFQKSLQYIVMICIPISVGMFLFAYQIIYYFYGLAGYEPSVLLLQIFAAGLILLYIDWVVCAVVVASDKQKQLSINAFIAIFLNIGLNYFMIPYSESHYANGAIGSAIATLLTEVFVMVAMFAILPKNISARFDAGVYLKMAAAGAAMAGSVLLLRAAGIHWIVQAIVSPFVYLGALLWSKLFEPGEVSFARSMLTKQNLMRMLVPEKGVSA